MSYKIERVTDVLEIGEGPHWDVERQTLYYVDIIGCTINKYKPSTNEHAKASIGVCPSFIIPLENTRDKFLISMLSDIAIVTWDGVTNEISNIEKISEIQTVEGLINNRLNDGKADPTGTLWTGSMDHSAPLNDNFPKTGNMYSLNKSRQLKHHFGGIQISNGLAWNADLTKFYFIDSIKKTIDVFDFDAENESISNRRSIFTLEKHNISGLPDGQAIDTQGNLWVAIFDGARVIKIDPRVPETLLQTIHMPSKKITSVAFGGKNLDELYVTTARHISEGEAPPTSADGATYRITGLGATGYAGVRVKL